MVDIALLRQEKDHYFGHAHDSPLTVDQREHFEGLRYFADDPVFRLTVTVDPAGAGGVEDVEMSDGSTEHLVRAGTVRFDVGGERVGLTALRRAMSSSFRFAIPRAARRPTAQAATSKPSRLATVASSSISIAPTTRTAHTTTRGAVLCRRARTGSRCRSARVSSPSISPDLIRPRIIHSDLHAKGLAGMLDVETSPRMQRILSRAAEIGKLHTGKPFVGTENVLRALIEDDDGIAVTVLRELGVAERVAERLDEIMGSSSYRGP